MSQNQLYKRPEIEWKEDIGYIIPKYLPIKRFYIATLSEVDVLMIKDHAPDANITTAWFGLWYVNSKDEHDLINYSRNKPRLKIYADQFLAERVGG